MTPSSQRTRSLEVLQALRLWRDNTARERGVPDYLILPNTTLNFIAQALPATDRELLLIKGIKEAKLREFGAAILGIVAGEESISGTTQQPPESMEIPDQSTDDTLTVSRYLDVLNRSLRMTGLVRIKGEVGQVKVQGGAVYFSLKDKDDGSVISMFMWKSAFQLYAIELTDGIEIIASGVSEIYKPTGRISFRADTIELAGVGALKLAYEKLKKRLYEEGVFAIETKRELPLRVEKIGLITSKTGAVIHDFLNNLGRYGYRVNHVDSRVEGVAAVTDILTAMKTLAKKDLDVLVLIRGGGSLESLQAFNNEEVVRAIKQFSIPVVCAIGHDQDVPLAQLASDFAPSTPTACAVLLNKGWEESLVALRQSELLIMQSMQQSIVESRSVLLGYERTVLTVFYSLAQTARETMQQFGRYRETLERSILLYRRELHLTLQSITTGFEQAFTKATQTITYIEQLIAQADPRHLVQLGFALVKFGDRYITESSRLKPDSRFSLEMKDGTIDAQVISIKQYDSKEE